MSRQKTCTVTLYHPVTIDGTEYSEINLRKPTPGDMRGKLSIDELGTDMNTTGKMIERCSFGPNIPASVALNMEYEDIMAITAGFGSFFDGLDPLSRVNMKKQESLSGSILKTVQKKVQK